MDEQRIVAFINNLISGTKSTFKNLSEKFLINLAKQIILSDYKNNLKFLHSLASEDYLIFLQQLIEIEIDNYRNNRNTKLIYLFLEEHQDKLDLKLAELITQWFDLATDRNNFKVNNILASLLLNNLGADIKKFPLGSRSNNIEIAITCYQNALTVYTEDAFTFLEYWAMTQKNLGSAYYSRIKGSIADNLELAITCYQNALTVYTKDAFPQYWAMIQVELGSAYCLRIKGSIADNYELAITCYQNALTVYTKDVFPQDWAMTQKNLGSAYSGRIKGSRTDNLELAITCHQNALTVYTKDAFPQDWATTQNNLANAYSDRIEGSIADNLETAIASYQNALTVRTKDAFPQDWATTQNNLAHAYLLRIKGSIADNLELAITYCENALTVYTQDAFPEQWAWTQKNLGSAYFLRIKGSRYDNLESAIACCENALTVYTQDTFPRQWAMTQGDLGSAYFLRIKGSRTDNLELAITCYQNALTVYTEDAFPEQWAMTQVKLANAYLNMTPVKLANAYLDMTPVKLANAYYSRIYGIKGEEVYHLEQADNLELAIACCENALTVYTKDTLPKQWAMTQADLALVYCARMKGETTDNLELGITCYQNALTVYTKDAFPQDWAMTQKNLGLVYLSTIKGEKANMELAIACCENALTVHTKDTFPQDHTVTLYLLGCVYVNKAEYYSNSPIEKQEALEMAYHIFKQAFEVVEYIRGDIIGSEAKTKLNEEWNNLNLQMVSVSLELGKYNTAIEYVDRSKARNLVEQIAIRDAYPEGDIPADVCQRLQELRNLIAEEDRRLQQNPDPDYQYVKQLREEYQEKFPYKPLSFAEIQKLLDKQTAILEWYILLDEKLLTFIITANSLKLQIFAKEDLDQLIDFGNEYLNNYRSNNDQWQNDLATRMQTLSNILHLPQLLESVFEELPQCEKLILMPHLYLHLFPIHALPVMYKGENKPLQEYFAQGVSYTPNCQLLQQTQKRQYSEFDRLFTIQNPTNDLSGADLELENIRNIFHPDKRNSLQRQYATKTNFLKKDLSQVHHLYFSCHGSFNIDEPLKSGLLLADAVLTLEEIISKLKLNQCSLVTLSACETGQVGIDQTDEYISLASGFILAGATSVLMSLWSVNQFSTAFLLIKTYEYLKDQLEAKQTIQLSIILRDAQNWLRNITIAQLKIWVNNSTLLTDDWRPAIIDYFNNDENFANMLKEHGENYCPYASPFHWAAFCIVGQAELKYFNQENSKMPSDANVIQAFIQLITTNPNDVLNGYWDKLDQLKKGISDDDEKNARSIENWLKQYEKLQQAYNELLPKNSLQREGNKIFRVTPPSEQSASLATIIDQAVKRNTELTENSPQPEAKPDTKSDTKTEDSEKPLS